MIDAIKNYIWLCKKGDMSSTMLLGIALAVIFTIIIFLIIGDFSVGQQEAAEQGQDAIRNGLQSPSLG